MNKQQTESPAGNSTFAIGGVSYSEERFAINADPGFRISICGEKPAHRKSAKR